jgi:serine/threonine protein kinase
MRCKSKETGKLYAVKIMNFFHDALQEITALEKCQGHDNIVAVVENLEDNSYKYIVFELLGGGELFQRIRHCNHFMEPLARFHFRQLVNAVEFMHHQNVVHRDLKTENIIFVDHNENSRLKIVDFGFACRVSAEETPPCFTLDYAAPESLTKGTTKKSRDIWSLGVILYTMLCGNTPFEPSDINKQEDEENYRFKLTENIKKGGINKDCSHWENLSVNAKNLIDALLRVDESDRPTFKDVFQHPWMKVDGPLHESVEYKIVEQPGPVELECGDESDHESVSTVLVPASKVHLDKETVAPQSLSRNSPPQKDINLMLKRHNLQEECNESELEVVDNFTAIKQSSISMVATPPQIKKQKTLPSLTLDSQSSGISTSSKMKQNCNENEIDKFTVIKRQGSRGVSTAPVLKEQKKKKNETKLKIKKGPKAKKPEVVVSKALNSTVELQTEYEQGTINKTQEKIIVLSENDPIDTLASSTDTPKPLSLEVSQSFEVDNFESFSENLLRNTPQIKDIASKTVTPASVPVSIPINIYMEAASAVVISESSSVCTESSSQIPLETSPNKILLYEEYKKLYNMRDCHITCNQLDPKKLDKILAKRKITPQKYKDGWSITLKQLEKSAKKSRTSEEKKVKLEVKLQKFQEKPQKSSEFKILVPNRKVVKSKKKIKKIFKKSESVTEGNAGSVTIDKAITESHNELIKDDAVEKETENQKEPSKPVVIAMIDGPSVDITPKHQVNKNKNM